MKNSYLLITYSCFTPICDTTSTKYDFLPRTTRVKPFALVCHFFSVLSKFPPSQVGFAELKETADDRANISGTIIGAPIVGQQLA